MLKIFGPIFDKKSKVANESLKKWNIIVAVLCLIQGGLILLLAVPYNLPVTILFTTSNSLESRITGQTVTAPGLHQLFTVNLIYLLAVFFLVSAVAHLLAATKYRIQYQAGLKKGISKLRWTEYAISSGIMLIVIGFIAGIYDIGTFLLFFVCAVVVSLTGYVLEINNARSKKTRLSESLSSSVGIIAGIVPWLVIAFYLLGTDIYGSGVSGYVYGVYASILVLFAAVAFNLYLLRNKKFRWGSDYLYGERWYMGLSLVAKSLLAWLVFIGAFHN